MAWPSCNVRLRHEDSTYSIEIINRGGNYEGVVEVTMDNVPLLYTGTVPRLDLRKHKGHHDVQVVVGRRGHASKRPPESGLEQERSFLS